MVINDFVDPAGTINLPEFSWFNKDKKKILNVCAERATSVKQDIDLVKDFLNINYVTA